VNFLPPFSSLGSDVIVTQLLGIGWWGYRPAKDGSSNSDLPSQPRSCWGYGAYGAVKRVDQGREGLKVADALPL
jgi:hypothetical protein